MSDEHAHLSSKFVVVASPHDGYGRQTDRPFAIVGFEHDGDVGEHYWPDDCAYRMNARLGEIEELKKRSAAQEQLIRDLAHRGSQMQRELFVLRDLAWKAHGYMQESKATLAVIWCDQYKRYDAGDKVAPLAQCDT